MSPLQSAAIITLGGKPSTSGHTLVRLDNDGAPIVVAISSAYETLCALGRTQTATKKVDHAILSSSEGIVTEAALVQFQRGHWPVAVKQTAPSLFQTLYERLRGNERHAKT